MTSGNPATGDWMMRDKTPGSRPVAIVGPTASGKSAVAMAVAATRDDIELVSVDSMQVYRGMNIGTATPSVAEQAIVRHHLIDLIDPSEEFTVAEFQSAYRRALADIAARGRRALLVGGTGLYHRAAIDDLEIPGEWPELKERLIADVATVGPQPLWRRLAVLDPAAAAKIEPTNTRRIVRALEVCEGSGRPFSSYGPGLDAYPVGAVTQVGLRWDRGTLARRIEARVAAMMEAGLVDEVANLDRSNISRTARQAIGYRELFAYLDGEISLDAAVDAIVVRTRQFAVRQIRWFQRDPRVHWVDVDVDVDVETPSITDSLTNPLGNPLSSTVPVVLEALA